MARYSLFVLKVPLKTNQSTFTQVKWLAERVISKCVEWNLITPLSLLLCHPLPLWKQHKQRPLRLDFFSRSSNKRLFCCIFCYITKTCSYQIYSVCQSKYQHLAGIIPGYSRHIILSVRRHLFTVVAEAGHASYVIPN